MIITQAIVPQDALTRMLEAWTEGDVTFTVGLFSNDIVPDPDASYSQFTDVPTLDPVSFTWNAPNLDENGQWHILKPSIEFFNDGGSTLDPAFGYYVHWRNADDHWWFAELFSTPVVFGPNEKKYISPELNLPGFTGSATLNW